MQRGGHSILLEQSFRIVAWHLSSISDGAALAVLLIAGEQLRMRAGSLNADAAIRRWPNATDRNRL